MKIVCIKHPYYNVALLRNFSCKACHNIFIKEVEKEVERKAKEAPIAGASVKNTTGIVYEN